MFFNWSGLAPPPAPPARRHGELVAFGEEPTFSLSTGASGCVGVTTLACLMLLSHCSCWLRARPHRGARVRHSARAEQPAVHHRCTCPSCAGCRRCECQHPRAVPPQVGTVVPDAHRLDYATDLFDIVDVDAQGFLDSKKLQARRASQPVFHSPLRL